MNICALPGRVALAALSALVVGACAGAPAVLPPPEDLAPLEATWAPLTRQVPASASAVYLLAFDERTRAELGAAFGALEAYQDVSEPIEDALGIDLAQASAFDDLGLRLGGGMALYLDGAFLVVVLDLADTSLALARIEAFEARNPDLEAGWREGEAGDVFTVDLPAPGTAGTAGPRAHVALAGDQLVAMLDLGPVPSPEGADARLAAIFGRSITEPVYLNPGFRDAVADFGGASWVLGYVDTAPVLGRIEQLMGVSTTGAACQALRSEVLASFPALTFAVQHGPAVGRSGVTEVSSRTNLRLSPAAAADAATLLHPVPVDLGVFHTESIGSFVLGMELGAAVELLADGGAPDDCEGAAGLVAAARRGANDLRGQSELLGAFDGTLGAALFDLRANGGITFADLFVVAGSADPVSLATMISAALEDATGAQGAIETSGDLTAIRYRVALIYQLTLYRAVAAVGVSLGRVPQEWLTTVMQVAEREAGPFFSLHADGERAYQAMTLLLDTITALADESTAEAQRAMFAGAVEELADLVSYSVELRLAGDRIEYVTSELREE
jgi:hypothetical protein